LTEEFDIFVKHLYSYVFSKIDRGGEGLVSQEQFRAAIECRFELGMSDEEWEKFLNTVPMDSEGKVQYVQFMSRFDTK
jgi:Ca2+-binding EF-hand superfamily protein